MKESGGASYCAQIRGSGSPTMESVQGDKGESNEIQKANYCCPGVGHRAHPVVAGNGTEHHTIHEHDDTESTRRADAEHYEHEYAGSDGSDAGPDQSDHGRDGYPGCSAGEADRFDDYHNHAPAEGKADRYDDDHNRAAARG